MQSHVLPHCSFSCSQGRVDVFFCTGATLLTCRPMNFSGGGGARQAQPPAHTYTIMQFGAML